MNVNFDGLKEICLNNKLVLISGSSSSNRQTALLKLLDDRYALISNQFTRRTFYSRIKDLNLDGKNIKLIDVKLNESMVNETNNCINDDAISTIVIEHSQLQENTKDLQNLILSLKNSGKNIIVGEQRNENMNYQLNKNIADMFDIKISVEHIDNNLLFKVI